MNAETFNALYEVGVPVFAYPDARPEDDADAERIVTRTRGEAFVFAGSDVVMVDGHERIALSHVDVVSEDEWKAARAAEESAAARVRHLRGQMRPAPPAGDALAAYESVDFTELMGEDAAGVVARMRDQMLGEIQRLKAYVARVEAALCECEPEREPRDYRQAATYMHAAGCLVADLQQVEAVAR